MKVTTHPSEGAFERQFAALLHLLDTCEDCLGGRWHRAFAEHEWAHTHNHICTNMVIKVMNEKTLK